MNEDGMVLWNGRVMTQKIVLSVLLALFFISFALPADAQTLATDEFHWKRVDNTTHSGKTYSFRLQGPAVITFRCVLQPFDGLAFYSKTDPVFRHNFGEGMDFVKGDESFDGKPLASYRVSSSSDLYRRVQVYRAWSTWKIAAGHSFEARVEVSAPGNDAGGWYQHAADAWFEVVHGDVGGGSGPAPAASGTQAKPVQGTVADAEKHTYELVANGYPGKIEIGDSQLNVRLWYEVTQKWETMTEVDFDPETETITFVRPWAGKTRFQVYTGKFSGSTIVGTFTDANSPGQHFPWQATF
jgi:hypothetical protein